MKYWRILKDKWNDTYRYLDKNYVERDLSVSPCSRRFDEKISTLMKFANKSFFNSISRKKFGRAPDPYFKRAPILHKFSNSNATNEIMKYIFVLVYFWLLNCDNFSNQGQYNVLNILFRIVNWSNFLVKKKKVNQAIT